MDCMNYLKGCENKSFDLAIIDPPYGINMDGGKIGGDNAGKATDYTKKDWDRKAPEKEFFIELMRVSKNQIIWGANHFISKIPFDSSCWLVWDKDNTGNFADCELAWTSFDTAVRKVKYRWNGMLQADMKNKEKRIHPTQKPMKFYKWIMENYAKPTDKILDTHLGSGSSAIAAHYFWCDFTGIEIDKEYFDKMTKRFENETTQTILQF